MDAPPPSSWWQPLVGPLAGVVVGAAIAFGIDVLRRKRRYTEAREKLIAECLEHRSYLRLLRSELHRTMTGLASRTIYHPGPMQHQRLVFETFRNDLPLFLDSRELAVIHDIYSTLQRGDEFATGIGEWVPRFIASAGGVESAVRGIEGEISGLLKTEEMIVWFADRPKGMVMKSFGDEDFPRHPETYASYREWEKAKIKELGLRGLIK